MREHGRYQIELHNRVVTVRFYEAWNQRTSEKMCREFQQKVAHLISEPWACLVDLVNWELGGPEVWEPIIEVNHWCNKNNQKLEAVVCSNAIQKYILQELQKALPNTESAFFHDEDDAKSWLNQKGFDI